MTHINSQTNTHGPTLPMWTAIFGKRVSNGFSHWTSIIFTHFLPAIGADVTTARALRELNAMTDRDLSDIGLGRSDLTAEGLKHAALRRAGRQALRR